MRRDFVANASHELKTPLTSIRGYVETLAAEEDLPQATRARFLEVIRNNVERLRRIIDDLLDLSRIESGTWHPDLRPVDPQQLARDAWSAHDADAQRRGVGFTATGGGTEAMADPGALRQVLENLYENALRHTPRSGRISVRVLREPDAGATTVAAPAGPSPRGWTVIEVQDTGSGIPRDALPRIFERFYRVDPARSRDEGGTGLGLSIVRHLMEGMGGSVAVASELGKGTTFRLRLPAA